MGNADEKLQLVRNLIQDLFNVSVTAFESENEIEIFSKKYCVIEQQSWLAPGALSLIVNNGSKSKISFFEDILNIRIVLFYYMNNPVIIGPYLPEKMTIRKCIQLCNGIDRKNMDENDLLIYFGKFPVIPKKNMNRIVRGIIKNLDLGDLEEHYVFYQGGDVRNDAADDLREVNKRNIEMHYCNERKYMEAIKKGNFHDAKHYRKLLSENAAGLWPIPLSKENLRIRFAINRAMSRIAAFEAGVPAFIIHKITTKETARIAQCHTEKQMEEACEEMLREFCKIIRNIKNEKYSAMVQSVVYFINQNYTEDITINKISEEIGISESHMIAQFKKETDTTPAIYLRDTRLNAAEYLLISTEEEIQSISGRVGIPDANYFIKLFKERYGMTPRAYRKMHKI